MVELKIFKMTREEKIQETYLELIGEEKYNLIKGQINKMGICEIMDCKHKFITHNLMQLGFKYEDARIDSWMNSAGGYFRPKSLKGIEDNNGWVKIENEGDLPKEHNFYDACSFNEKLKNDVTMFYGCNLPDLRNYFDEKLITHYRPVIRYEYPLF